MKRALVLIGAFLLTACPPPLTLPPQADGGSGGFPDAGLLPDGGPSTGAKVTWYRDVAPLTQAHCQGCHSAGGIAPFALSSYAEARVQAPRMANAVSSGLMPPWMPSPNCQSFRDSRRLTAEQIDVFNRWNAQGAPEGDPADAPAPFNGGAGLPVVSATLTPSAAYTPSSTLTDDYRCFILNPALTVDRDLIAYEIQPGVRSMVHHVILYGAGQTEAQALDDQEAGPGWTCFGGPGTGNPQQMLGGWVPGTSTVVYPATTGVQMGMGRVIVMQVHYNRLNIAGAPPPDLTTVKLQYADNPVAKRATILPLADGSFHVPVGKVGYSHSASTNAPPVLTTLWGVLPHMHTHGKKINVTYAGNTCLVDIPAWDFHWQQMYFYQQPITLTPGNDVTLTCTWDNPGSTVLSWGEKTTDEMCLNYFYLTP